MVGTDTTSTSEMQITRSDAAGPPGWNICDSVTQLREWGTGITYLLPLDRDELTIGSAEDCWLRLWDLTGGRISKRHAGLTRGAGGWSIYDCQSKNGVYLDGSRLLSSSSLVPGTEIRIGPTILVAESPQFVALRALVERFIGWAEERREEVDQVLASIRIAVSHREPLLLCGDGNLIHVARLIHQHAVGARPFVVCKPRSPYATGVDALAAAVGGTLCLRRHEQPADFDKVIPAVRGPLARVMLMICAHALPRGDDVASQVVTVVRSIFIPPLTDRARELDRLIGTYVDDAIAAFDGRGWFSSEDREWVIGHASRSLYQISTATRRIIALHACGEKVTPAARLLGMTHGSLSIWVARREFIPAKPEMPYDDEEEEAE